MVWPDPSDPGRSADTPLSDAPSRSLPESKIPLEHLAALLARPAAGFSAPAAALTRIAEQACLATAAIAAAIALKNNNDDQFVCRASSGVNAPPVGAQLSVGFGLTGLCIRDKTPQHCQDAACDPRVDPVACRNLNVRSLLVLPLLRGADLLGIFEAFSPEPHAFDARDVETLAALAGRILENLNAVPGPPVFETARPFSTPDLSPPPPQNAPAAPSPPVESSPVETVPPEIVPETPPLPSPSAGFSLEFPPDTSPPEEPVIAREPFASVATQPLPRDWTTTALIVMVILLAVLLGWMVGRVSWLHRGMAEIIRNEPPVAAAPASPPRTPAALPPATTPVAESSPPVKPPVRTAAPKSAPVPAPGGLVVYQEGKVIFQQSASPVAAPAASPQGSASSPGVPSAGGSQVVLSAEQADTYVVHRVEPRYPDLARRQHIQGPVLFEVWVGKNGGIQKLHVLSGNPELVDAAANAIRSWRFRPYAPNGKPVEFTTRLTVNFVLQENP